MPGLHTRLGACTQVHRHKCRSSWDACQASTAGLQQGSRAARYSQHLALTGVVLISLHPHLLLAAGIPAALIAAGSDSSSSSRSSVRRGGCSQRQLHPVPGEGILSHFQQQLELGVVHCDNI